MQRRDAVETVSAAYFKARLAKEVPERELQEWVIEYLRNEGYLVYHTGRSTRSEPGFPDLVAAKRGAPVWFIECKRENGKLSKGRLLVRPRSERWLPGQDEWAEVLGNRADVHYLLVRPSMWLNGEFERVVTGW